MEIFLFLLGGLLFAFGAIAVIVNLPEGCQNMPLSKAISVSFTNKKFTANVLCTVIGFLIVFAFLMW